MVGPVLYQEMLMGSRHGRWHRFRWLYAGWLVVVVGVLLLDVFATRRPSFSGLSLMAGRFIAFFTSQHFILLTMATPVLVAGSITDEKTRGTLQYLLTSDLLSWELIVGKMAGRIYQVLMLVLIGLPLFCFFGIFAGIGPIKVLGFLALSLVLVFGLGAASTLASVWCRQTRDAVLSLYFLGILAGLALGLPAHFWSDEETGWLNRTVEMLNPFLPLGPYWVTMRDAEYLSRLGEFALFWGGLGFICLMLSTWRLRRAYRRQLEGAGRQRRQRHWWHFERPPVSNSPLSWKERYIEGIAPLALLRHIPLWLGVILVFVLSVTLYGSILLFFLPIGINPGDIWDMALALDFEGLLNVARRLNIPHYVFWGQGVTIMLLTMLVIGVRCSGAVTREQQTWEALLLTPLTTRQLIRGKLWGIAGACVPYLIAYAIPALTLSVIAGPAAFFWTLLWFALQLLAIWYAGAAGIYCSVQAKSSWRSLLNTLLFIYGLGLVFYLIVGFLALTLACFVTFLIAMSQLGTPGGGRAFPGNDFVNVLLISFSLMLGGAFFFMAWRLLISAEYQVSIRERTKHWKGEPKRPIARAPRRRQPQLD